MLRALLYETLMLFNRVPMMESLAASSIDEMFMIRYIAQFQQLVERDFMEHHDVEYYADKLCITSNYLNKVVKQTLGMTTKQFILSRIMTEAKRMLSYTSLSVAEDSTASAFRVVHLFRSTFSSSRRRYTQSVSR